MSEKSLFVRSDRTAARQTSPPGNLINWAAMLNPEHTLAQQVGILDAMLMRGQQIHRRPRRRYLRARERLIANLTRPRRDRAGHSPTRLRALLAVQRACGQTARGGAEHAAWRARHDPASTLPLDAFDCEPVPAVEFKQGPGLQRLCACQDCFVSATVRIFQCYERLRDHFHTVAVRRASAGDAGLLTATRDAISDPGARQFTGFLWTRRMGSKPAASCGEAVEPGGEESRDEPVDSDGGRADRVRRAGIRHLLAPAQRADHLSRQPNR